jgi:hypothetical protein
MGGLRARLQRRPSQAPPQRGGGAARAPGAGPRLQRLAAVADDLGVRVGQHALQHLQQHLLVDQVVLGDEDAQRRGPRPGCAGAPAASARAHVR